MNGQKLAERDAFKKNWQISTFVSEIAPKTKIQVSGVVLVRQI